MHARTSLLSVAARGGLARKVRKYRPICERIGAQFRPAAIERHGHCGDGMCSVIKLLSGDGARNLAEDDISFYGAVEDDIRLAAFGLCCGHG